jgi:hypothetical protein
VAFSDEDSMTIDPATHQTILFFVQILSLIFLIIYVVKTWEMASATRKAAEATEKSVLEMREHRDAEIAPYVVASLDEQRPINGILSLVIKNTGKTVAKNVKLIFDPPLQTRYPDLLDWVLPSEGIPSIPPGYEIRTTLDNFVAYKKTGPMKFTVTVTYFGGINNNVREDSYHIDLMLFRGIVHSVENKPPSETEKALQKLQRSTESIAGDFWKISEGISRIGRKPVRRISKKRNTSSNACT